MKKDKRGDAFEVYWRVKNQYNSKNLKAFFEVPFFNYLFHSYAESPHLDQYIDDMIIKDDVKRDKSQEWLIQYKALR